MRVIPGVSKFFCITKFVFKFKSRFISGFRISVAADLMMLIDWRLRITCSTLKFDEKNISDWFVWHCFKNCILSDKNLTSSNFSSLLVITFSPCVKFIIYLISERDVPILWFSSSVIVPLEITNAFLIPLGYHNQCFGQLHDHIFVNKLN